MEGDLPPRRTDVLFSGGDSFREINMKLCRAFREEHWRVRDFKVACATEMQRLAVKGGFVPEVDARDDSEEEEEGLDELEGEETEDDKLAVVAVFPPEDFVDEAIRIFDGFDPDKHWLLCLCEIPEGDGFKEIFAAFDDIYPISRAFGPEACGRDIPEFMCSAEYWSHYFRAKNVVWVLDTGQTHHVKLKREIT